MTVMLPIAAGLIAPFTAVAIRLIALILWGHWDVL